MHWALLCASIFGIRSHSLAQGRQPVPTRVGDHYGSPLPMLSLPLISRESMGPHYAKAMLKSLLYLPPSQRGSLWATADAPSVPVYETSFCRSALARQMENTSRKSLPGMAFPASVKCLMSYPCGGLFSCFSLKNPHVLHRHELMKPPWGAGAASSVTLSLGSLPRPCWLPSIRRCLRAQETHQDLTPFVFKDAFFGGRSPWFCRGLGAQPRTPVSPQGK